MEARRAHNQLKQSSGNSLCCFTSLWALSALMDEGTWKVHYFLPVPQILPLVLQPQSPNTTSEILHVKSTLNHTFVVALYPVISELASVRTAALVKATGTWGNTQLSHSENLVWEWHELTHRFFTEQTACKWNLKKKKKKKLMFAKDPGKSFKKPWWWTVSSQVFGSCIIWR